jgi:hypothetical protein
MESGGPRKTPVVFYQTPAGGAVMLDWLKRLAGAERAIIGQDLMRVQFRWPVGMPLWRPLGDGLWEVRSNCPSNRVAAAVLPRRRQDRRAARLHQEDATDAGR